MGMIKGGKVSVGRIGSSDVLPARALLDHITTDALRQRKEAQAKKGHSFVKDDPVHVHLFSLTMKLRTGPEHAEEVLQHNGLNGILSIMEQTRLQKYNKKQDVYSAEADNKELFHQNFYSSPKATTEEELLAKELCMDVGDILGCIGVLHELCRYRSGCVALAQDQKCLDFILHDIPKAILIIMSGLCMRDFGEPKQEDGNMSWGSWLAYNPGMIEQGTIDTAGRLLNGLDQHPQLRKKLAKKLLREMAKLKHQVVCLEEILLPMGKLDPTYTHCLNLGGSLKNLQTMVSAIQDKPNSKSTRAWKSAFLLDRNYIDDPNKIDEEDDKIANKRECHFCHKEPEGPIKQCSKCKTVFYCSRECQVADWKKHKKHCVKHGGVLPSDKSAHSGHMNQMLASLQKAERELKAKKETK